MSTKPYLFLDIHYYNNFRSLSGPSSCELRACLHSFTKSDSIKNKSCIVHCLVSNTTQYW